MSEENNCNNIKYTAEDIDRIFAERAPLWGGALLVVLCAVVAILFNVIGN